MAKAQNKKRCFFMISRIIISSKDNGYSLHLRKMDYICKQLNNQICVI